MRMIYWRPSTIPRAALLVTAFLALAALSSVELIKVQKKKTHYSEKFRASLSMKRGMDVIKNYRIKHVSVDFLLKHRDAEHIVPFQGVPGIEPGISQWGQERFDGRVHEAGRFYPHRIDSVGFFMAKIRRRG